MERYEKLYEKIDEAFKGTPNTPSALSAKSEIVDNLIARYDELLEKGISEEDATEQVMNSVGDLDELFGIRRVTSDGEQASFDQGVPSGGKAQYEYRTLTEEEEENLWKRKQMRSLASALYILSILPPILIAVGLSWKIACGLMFLLWALPTALIIGAGAWTPGANPKKKWLLACGVGMYIGAFVPMFFLMGNPIVAVCALFAGWAVATMLVLMSASIKTSEYTKVKYAKIKNDGLNDETRRIWRPIRALLIVLTLAVYLWFSIAYGSWIYSWLIWIIYGCLCDAVKALIVLISRKGEGQ